MVRTDATLAHCEGATQISEHAQQRLRQRGFLDGDIDRLRRYGETFEDGFLMSKRAITAHISQLKSEIQRLERLRNSVLIEQDDTVVTVYRSDRRRQKKILSGRLRRDKNIGRSFHQ